MTSRAGYALLFLLTATFACRSGSSGEPPRAASEGLEPDAGLPVPPPSTKKGIFTPADTGLGGGATGTTSTGTNGRAVSPTIGSSPGSN